MPAVATEARVNTPVEAMVASPDIALVSQEEPSAISRLPEVTAVEPRVLPLILATVVLLWVPVTSPAREPVKLVEVATEMEEVAVQVGTLPLIVRIVPALPVAMVTRLVVDELPINR